MEEEKMTLPVIALRGLTMLPQMTINFDIMRGKSIAAVEKAMLGDQKVFLVTQMEQEDMEPDLADLFQIGVVGFVKQLLKLPGGLIRVTVEGLSRAELLELDTEGEFYSGTIDVLPEAADDLEPLEKEAMTRIVGEKLEEYGKYNPAMGKEFAASLMAAPDFEGLLTQIAVQFPWDYTAKQKILECGSLSLMYEVEMQLILTETEIYLSLIHI